jgi:hypothetical protein
VLLEQVEEELGAALDDRGVRVGRADEHPPTHPPLDDEVVGLLEVFGARVQVLVERQQSA